MSIFSRISATTPRRRHRVLALDLCNNAARIVNRRQWTRRVRSALE
ncbi:MAG: hypothetical protein VB140_10580 [Burkholderia sp.]